MTLHIHDIGTYIQYMSNVHALGTNILTGAHDNYIEVTFYYFEYVIII